MLPYEKLKLARQNGRPTSVTYIRNIISDRIELHGDRYFADDFAIVSGIGSIDGMPITYIAIEKGNDISTRIKTNFGSPKPEGYRKALRLMKQAEKFHRPVVCFVDTQGAYCGIEGEERGQGEAIAKNIMEMFGLRTPTISIIIGEGGSGGALALCATDYVYMMENAVYSVISPEGCASILWKDVSKAEEAARCLRITADDMKKFGIVEKVFSEKFEDFSMMCNVIKENLKVDLSKLLEKDIDTLLEERYMRFRKFGIFEENGVVCGKTW